MPDLCIGILGWTYAPWRGVLFPRGLSQKRELAFAARQVRSIEINGTFYSMQRLSSFFHWYEQTPDDFVFSLKGPRFIANMKRLKNVMAPIAKFFASGVLALEEKLGPILWQLPPKTRFDPERLTEFFHLLPRTTHEAGVLGRHHDHRLKARAGLKTSVDRPLRHAIEIRQPSFEHRDFIELLRQHDIALVVADTAGKWPLIGEVTTDFDYVRLHGDKELYASGYCSESLGQWAGRIRGWVQGGDAGDATTHRVPTKVLRRGRHVYVYFDNDIKTHAPFDAISLAHQLGLSALPEVPRLAAPVPEAVRTRWPDGPAPARPDVAVRRAIHAS